jgi:aspartate kinase
VVAEENGIKALQVVHACFGLGGDERHQAQGSASPLEKT